MTATRTMIYRAAGLADIPQIQIVRHSVKENVLSDPALVTDADCATYLTERGKGWVCEVDGQVVGFAIADLLGHNIWALFLLPVYEGRGIGRHLQRLMLDWYFGQTQESVWLSTEPGSRAADFYQKSGWHYVGIYGKGELKFEFHYADWLHMRSQGS
jgi:GNAT superfamily N-acetyltransferase